jgi:hypothetical protein
MYSTWYEVSASKSGRAAASSGVGRFLILPLQSCSGNGASPGFTSIRLAIPAQVREPCVEENDLSGGEKYDEEYDNPEKHRLVPRINDADTAPGRRRA